MYNIRSIARGIVAVSLIAVMAGCTAQKSDDAGTSGTPPIESQSGAQTGAPGNLPTEMPVAHTWAGSGFKYTSDKLGFTVEFPPEWESKIEVHDRHGNNGGVELDYIQIDLVDSWLPGDPDGAYVGFIYKFTKEEWEKGAREAESIPDGLFECGQRSVMAETEDLVIVVIAHHVGPTCYEDPTSQGRADADMIYSGLMNREYEIYITG